MILFASQSTTPERHILDGKNNATLFTLEYALKTDKIAYFVLKRLIWVFFRNARQGAKTRISK